MPRLRSLREPVCRWMHKGGCTGANEHADHDLAPQAASGAYCASFSHTLTLRESFAPLLSWVRDRGLPGSRRALRMRKATVARAALCSCRCCGIGEARVSGWWACVSCPARASIERPLSVAVVRERPSNHLGPRPAARLHLADGGAAAILALAKQPRQRPVHRPSPIDLRGCVSIHPSVRRCLSPPPPLVLLTRPDDGEGQGGSMEEREREREFDRIDRKGASHRVRRSKAVGFGRVQGTGSIDQSIDWQSMALPL